MTNVGTAALASALVLVNGDESTAIAMIDLIKEAALARLKIEFDLGLSLIANGESTKEKEIDILSTWNAYYVNAIGKARDLGKGDRVDESILTTQKELIKNLDELLKGLK